MHNDAARRSSRGADEGVGTYATPLGILTNGAVQWGMEKTAAVAGAVVVLAFGAYCATHSVDFQVYHHAAQQVLHGDFDLYPTAVYDGGVAPPHGFRYAPIVAFLFAPLGLVSVRTAAFAFFVLKMAAVLYIGRVAARHAGVMTRTAPLIVWSLAFVAGYLVEEFRFGNVHFLCVMLMVLAFDAAWKGRIVVPAVALSLAIAVKLTPVLLLAHFAWRRRFAVCGATLAVLVVFAWLPAAIVGRAENSHLLRGFAAYAIEKMGESDNYSFRGVLLRSGLMVDVATTVWIAGVVAGAAIVVAALPAARSEPMTRWLEFSVVLTATLLASPHTQRRYFVTLYVPVLALVAILMNQRRWLDDVLVWMTLAVTALAGTILPLLLGSRRAALAYESLAPYFFATLLMFFALIVLSRRTAGAVRGEPHALEPQPVSEISQR
ncbi:MAG: glycosyltransferase family 87 protein [Vicinamibacterales bacterium]